MAAAYTLDHHVPERRKAELQEILSGRAESACRKYGLYLKAVDDQKPADKNFAEFWYRTGRARLTEHKHHPYISFAGLLQFSIYLVISDRYEQLDRQAADIAKAFSVRSWPGDEIFLNTDRVIHQWLPESKSRGRVCIVDGSFDFGVPMSEI